MIRIILNSQRKQMPTTSLPSESAPVAVSKLIRLRNFFNQMLFSLDSTRGRRFNLFLITMITLSALASMIGTIPGLGESWQIRIHYIEVFTSWAFAVELVLRLLVARRPAAYLFSFYGLVDFLAVLPLLLFGLPLIELRLLRIVRLLKLVRYLKAMRMFIAGLRDSIEILLMVIGTISLGAILAGNLAYMMEPETFGDAFTGAWWSIVTMSTVGYGDLVPTTLGVRLLAILLMGVGISLFAIVTATLSVKVARLMSDQRECQECHRKTLREHHYCPRCGNKMD